MKVSIDGMRHSLTSETNSLGQTIIDLRGELHPGQWLELVENFNSVAQYVGTFNCIYADNMEDFNDLSEKLDVVFIDAENN